MSLPWTAILALLTFTVVAIMTFFGCPYPRIWFGGSRRSPPGSPHGSTYFGTIRYSNTKPGSPPADIGAAAPPSTPSQVSPRTVPNDAEGLQDASSSTHSRPTNSTRDSPAASVRTIVPARSSLEQSAHSARHTKPHSR
ncbi:hypothetical protein SLS59_002953 [Nothophoma quercina]|uniref:Uncharacterized protein n=1 Tax=Nothophoma quercina TaxID=749835 RepID=A0ABR3RP01_9PLEO